MVLPLDHLRQQPSNLGISVLADVLISQSHCRLRVAKPTNQINQRRTRLRGQDRASAPQVMKPQIGSASSLPSPIPLSKERTAVKVPTPSRREQQAILPPLGEGCYVITHSRQQMRRDRHVTDAGCTLRSADDS